MKSCDTSDAPQAEERHPVDRKFQGKESFLSSQISLCVQETKPNIPDGGWGWLVLFAAFTLNVISEGVTFTFGLLYIEFLKEFNASKSATSWIGSLFMATPLLVGPLASALVDKYGCKYMTIAGGIVTAIGFIISAYARSIGVMYVTFGVIGGVGRGLTYVTAVVVNAFWFEKRRSVALGIAASGAGFGTIIFSPLTTVLLEAYGWRGTLLVTAGCFANMCVCGMLMRDPDWMIEEQKQKKKVKSNKNAPNSVSKALQAKDLEALKNAEESQVLLKNGGVGTSEGKDKSESMVNLPTYSKQDKHDLHPISSIKEVDEPEDNQESPREDNTQNDKDKSHWSYTKSLRYKRNSVGHRGALFQIDKFKARASSCPNISRGASSYSEEDDEKWYGVFLVILKELSHFSLFLELHFLLLCCSTIILFTWFIVPYFYLADHMTEIGYSNSQATLAISVIGIANTVGMVALGWIGDKLNVAKTYAVCLILCGVSVLSMMYFTTNYILLIINCVLFGLLFASCFALTPSLLATLVPLEDFTMAYGLELLCEGIGNLTGPPVAGFLYDVTRSWHQSFYQAGFWIIGSGILIGAIAYTKNRRLLGSGPLRNHRNNKNSPSV